MPYILFMSDQIMYTDSLPLQMAERLRRAQPVSVANHVKARQSLIERAVTWLATKSGWAWSKRSTICSGKLCEGFMILGSADRALSYCYKWSKTVSGAQCQCSEPACDINHTPSSTGSFNFQDRTYHWGNRGYCLGKFLQLMCCKLTKIA